MFPPWIKFYYTRDTLQWFYAADVERVVVSSLLKDNHPLGGDIYRQHHENKRVQYTSSIHSTHCGLFARVTKVCKWYIFLWCKPELQVGKSFAQLQAQVICKHILWLVGCLPTDQDTSCTSSKEYLLWCKLELQIEKNLMFMQLQGGCTLCGLVGVSYWPIARHIWHYSL